MPYLPSSVVVCRGPLSTSDRVRAVLGDDLADRVDRGLAAGRPSSGSRFILRAGGVPWEAGSAVIKTWRTKSDTTQRDYATDLKTWLDWCEVNEVDPDNFGVDDVLDFREDRLDVDEVSPDTWNRNLTVLVKHVDYLIASERMRRAPWTDSKDLRVRSGTRPIRSVDQAAYRKFRDVGLRGLRLDGSLDPDFTGTTPTRDGLFADLLVTTGMRRVEATHLLLFDLPQLEPAAVSGRAWLPGPVCKNERGRPLRTVSRWHRQLAAYHASEWRDLASRSQAALRRRRADLLLVTAWDGDNVEIDGRWRALSRLDRATRQRIVATPEVARTLGLPVDDGWLVPVHVFPGTRSPGTSPSTWTLIFRQASRRVALLAQQAGAPHPARVTPHMLRHTFAVQYLEGRVAGITDADRTAAREGDFSRIQRFLMNPLLEVKELLGHANLDTTLGYLREIARRDPLTDLDHTSWSDAFLEATANTEAAT